MIAIASVTVMLVLGLTLLVAGAIRLRADRARLAAARVDADRPGCSTCLSPLGGWSSPGCPECGADVVAGGVRVGPTSGRGLVRWGAGLLVVSVALPTALLGVAWLLDTRMEMRSIMLTHASPAHRVELEVVSDWSRLPPVDRGSVDVTVRPRAPRASPEWRTTVSSNDRRLTVDDWAAGIAEGADIDPDHPGVTAAATSVAVLVEALLRDGPDAADEVEIEPYDSMVTTARGTRSGQIGWRLPVVFVLGSVMTAGMATWAGRRVGARLPEGSRPVRESEWLVAVGDATSGTAPLSPPRSA